MANAPDRLRVYVDADVLLASAASPSSHSAGQVVQPGELMRRVRARLTCL